MSSYIENQMDKILDEYLEGNISEAEVKAIHQRLQLGDPLLDVEQELEKIKLPADLLVSTLGTETIAPALPPNTSIEAYLDDREVMEWNQENTDSAKALKMAQRYVLLGVILFAVVLLIPMMHLFLPFFNTQPLFNKYFELPTMEAHLLIQNQPKLQSLWGQAADYYEAQAFTPAINTLTEVVKLDQSSEADFYIGVAYLAKRQHQPRLAIEHLEDAKQNSHLFTTQTQWYLALAHLKNGNPQTCQDILKTIVEQDDVDIDKKDNAKQLLQDLEAFLW